MIFMPRDLITPATSSGVIVEWEEPDCLLCGGSHWQPVIEAPDNTKGGTGLWFAVVQCQSCGLCFTNPRPSATSIGQFYPSAYRPHRAPRKERHRKVRLRLMPEWGRPRKERQALPWHGEGRLLDFGCGGGSYLERMHRQGWRVLGMDTSAAAVERIQTVLGLPALEGTLPHPRLVAGSFDVITMWHSLEHVHRPVEILREAHRLLAPGGKLLVAVPNIDSLPFRMFRGSWYGLDLPRHLTHFSPWTLHLILEHVGFRVDPIRMVRHSDWFRSSAKLSCQDEDMPRWHRLLTFKPLSRLATWYSYVSRQCDCMIVTAHR